MANKTDLLFEQEAQDKILNGVEKVYRSVSTTLGPRGRNVLIARADPTGEIYGRSIIHDGAMVAKVINLEDEFENAGAAIITEAASKTVDEVGDGTTLTIVLAHAIIKACAKIIATGINPMALRSGLEKGRQKLLTALESYAKPIKTQKEETYVATVSGGDNEIGTLVGDVLHKMGTEGVVKLERTREAKTRVEYQNGMQLEHGFLHEFFMTDPATGDAVLENPYILITDKEINALAPIGDLLQVIAKEGRGLVIITPSVGMEALGLLIKNKAEGQLQVLAIKAPAFGNVQKAMLQDIAILTNGTFISEDAGWRLADVKIEHLGRCGHVTANARHSLIYGGLGKKELVKKRIAYIRQQLAKEESEFEQVKFKERLGKLSNGIAIIYVGGYTEAEMNERYERIDDAVHATRAAMQKGIIAGGEISLLKAREKLDQTNIAEKILYDALQAPFDKLVANAGKDAGQLRAQLPVYPHGYDVTDHSFKDFMQAGLVDPVLVPMKALENATSVAIQLMTTAAIITPTKKREKLQ